MATEETTGGWWAGTGLTVTDNADLTFKQSQQEFDASSPYSKFQYLDVVFGAANTDLDIKHQLVLNNPEAIDYQIMRADRATAIYHDQSGTRKPWGAGYVILRSSAANAAVTLLLTIRKA